LDSLPMDSCAGLSLSGFEAGTINACTKMGRHGLWGESRLVDRLEDAAVSGRDGGSKSPSWWSSSRGGTAVAREPVEAPLA